MTLPPLAEALVAPPDVALVAVSVEEEKNLRRRSHAPTTSTAHTRAALTYPRNDPKKGLAQIQQVFTDLD